MREHLLTLMPIALIASGCAKAHAEEPRGDPPVASPSPPEPEPQPRPQREPEPSAALPALDAPPIERWEEDDFDVYVAAPSGARQRRPVVVGIHGAGDRADWACEKWRETTAGFAFVVCPSGVRWRPRFAWGSPELLAERADRALEMLRERYGRWVADGPVVYGGWSQGGTLAARAIARRPGVYHTAILVEVGHTPLSASRSAERLSKGEVSRVIVSCATRPCERFARRMQRAARDRGLRFSLNDGGIGRGHFFDEPMFRTLGYAMSDALADDERWRGLGEAVAAKWPEP